MAQRIHRQASQYNQLSKNGAIGLSEIRRAEISQVVNRATDDRERGNDKPNMAVAHSRGFTKEGSISTTLPTTREQVERLAPDVYSPLFLIANLNLPRDRVTMNAWNRIFYDTHPIVRNAINLHSSYPISKINISCKEKKVQQFFMEMAERIDLYSIIYGVALEYWKHGEAFPYAELDQKNGTWKRITVLNPDFVHVKKAAVGDHSLVSLRPDAALQRMITSNAPADVAARKQIPPQIVEFVRKGLNIPLDPLNISHLKLLSSSYDIRGTSVIVSVYKDLVYFDKIRECKFAQADGMINPITLVKVGGSGEYRPTQSDLEAYKNILEEAQYDKDFKLVTHDGVTIERVGFSGATLDVGADLDLIINNLYTGLMVPKALMDQESVTFASSSVGLEVLRQRYDLFRNMIKKWLERKVFAPICELQGFYEMKDGERRLIVPTVDFNHMNLYDMMDYVSQIAPMVGTSVSQQTLYRSLGLSYDEERKRLREEAIHTAVLQKEKEALQAMPLSQLLSLNPDEPIPEPIGSGGSDMAMSLPGVSPLSEGGTGGLPPISELSSPGGPGGEMPLPEGGPPPGGPPPGGPPG